MDKDPKDNDDIDLHEPLSEQAEDEWGEKLEAEADTPDAAPLPEKEVVPTDDAGVSEAVDEIVNEESDQLMAAEDEARERQFAPPVEKKSWRARLKSLFMAWWENKRLRYGTFIGLFVLLVAGMLVPFTRYGMLNLAGVRVSSSMEIIDSTTGLPLKNIPVRLQNQEVRSDDEGRITFSNLKLGSAELIIEKRGYAPFEKQLTLGWGSNPIGQQTLVATGTRITFVLRDFLNDQPIIDAEATSGEDVAQADKEGKIVLTIGEATDESEIVVKAEHYREERFVLSELGEGEQQLKLVPAKKHAFVSNRNGEYDLYTIDVDGTNEKILLEATGKEREVPYVLPSQTRDVVAYVSSRDGDVNSGGFIMDGLFVIDTVSGETYKVARSEQLQVIGWSGNRLVYVAVIEGASAGNSQRSKLVSFDLETRERTELAASNYFNDVKLIGDTVYFAVSSYAVPRAQAKLFSVKADGEDKQTLVSSQVWSIVRKDYETLLLSAEDGKWYEQALGGEVKQLEEQPVSRNSRVYAAAPDGKRAVWVDVRDGKGVLLSYDTEAKSEQIVRTEPGLGEPLYWLSDSHVVFRVSTSQQTADYVMSLDGGEPRKMADVVGNQSRYFY